MNDSTLAGMAKVEQLYENYGSRARELKKQGTRFIGYICSFVPLEIIAAAGFVPFRIRGDVNDPNTKGDAQLETIACPFMRSCFDQSLKGNYDFMEGVIIPHACDSMTRSYSVWSYSLDLPYSHFVNVPHTVSKASIEFFEAELGTFRKSLGDYAGKKITDADLAEAIAQYNENRTKAKALYELRKVDPPMVTGTEMAKVLTVGMSLPVAESNELFDQVLAEFKARTAAPAEKKPRIMVDGACIDNVEIFKLIEDSGANVVADSLCLGTRDHWPLTPTDGSPTKRPESSLSRLPQLPAHLSRQSGRDQ